jgi:fructose-1,6-bisphosphatase II
MDRNLALELVRVTEAAALASARWMGKGDAHKADEAAVEAMRKAFSAIQFSGTVVIGEGERDEAPMLFIGEKLGNGKPPRVDIALDPLECTNSVAFGRPNALSVVALAEHGHFLHAPDTYMEKIATGTEAMDAIDLAKPVEENLKNIADAKKLPVENLTVVILDRQRHEELVRRVRKLGCRIQLIPDGDVSGAIAAALPDSGVDALLGTGGAPEGVLAAAALRCLGGGFQGRLAFRNEEEIRRAKKMGIKNPNKIYTCEELARGDNIMFACTGVTDGEMLKGVHFLPGGAETHSLVMRSKTQTLRFITTRHSFDRMPDYDE